MDEMIFRLVPATGGLLDQPWPEVQSEAPRCAAHSKTLNPTRPSNSCDEPMPALDLGRACVYPVADELRAMRLSGSWHHVEMVRRRACRAVVHVRFGGRFTDACGRT